MTRDPSPKKSETIEIRLDHETKSALQARARAEGRSVSEILRDLIARYLGADVPSSTIERSVNIMKFSSIAAVAVAAVVGAFMIATPAGASDFSFGVVARLDPGGIPESMPEAPEVMFEASFDHPLVLCIPRSAPNRVWAAAPDETCEFDADSGFIYTIEARPDGPDYVRLGWNVRRPEDPPEGPNAPRPPESSMEYGSRGEWLQGFTDWNVGLRVTLFVERASTAS